MIREVFMHKDKIPTGSDVSSGTFQCSRHADMIITVPSVSSLPPCQKCVQEGVPTKWKRLTGCGDAKNDPYPNK